MTASKRLFFYSRFKMLASLAIVRGCDPRTIGSACKFFRLRVTTLDITAAEYILRAAHS